MSGTIRVTPTRMTVRGIQTAGFSAHLDDTQHIASGSTQEAAIENLLASITKYGWSADRNCYHIPDVSSTHRP